MKLKDIKLGVDGINSKFDVKKWLDEMPELEKEIMYLFGFDKVHKVTIAENIMKYSNKRSGLFSTDLMFQKLKDAKSSEFILVHNHPSPTPVIPTDKDMDTTKEIKKLAEDNGLVFIDHFVYGSFINGDGLLWSLLDNPYLFIKTKCH